MPRFIILEHTGAPDDPAGRHYDLLLEDGAACRTWRLAALPELGGPTVEAIEVSPHRLAWLSHEAGAVSGGRGFARRIDAGTYEPVDITDTAQTAVVDAILCGTRMRGRLELRARDARWFAKVG
jgi:hypothetical protein